MALLQRPRCPNCGSAATALHKTPANFARVLAGATLAVFVGDVVPILWRCGGCAEVFTSIGANADENQRSRGFPLTSEAPDSSRSCADDGKASPGCRTDGSSPLPEQAHFSNGPATPDRT